MPVKPSRGAKSGPTSQPQLQIQQPVRQDLMIFFRNQRWVPFSAPRRDVRELQFRQLFPIEGPV
jgi:hypothetical protein